MKKIINLFFYIYYGRNFEKIFTHNSKKIFGTDKEKLVYKVKKCLLEVDLEKNFELLDVKENELGKFYNIKKSFHQYMWVKFINTEFFTMHLILSIALNKKFFFPLPKIYIQNISNLVGVNYFLSKFLWIIALGIIFSKDLLMICVSFFSFLKITKNSNYIYCKSLSNIGSRNSKNMNYDNFFSWLFKRINLKNSTVFLHTNKKIKNYTEENNPDIKIFSTKYKKNIDFIIFGLNDLSVYISAFFDCLRLLIRCLVRKKFNSVILLFEIFKFKIFLNSRKTYQYALFNNSYMVYRPLWTYAQENKKKGSVIFYFYSINNDPLLHLIKGGEYIHYSVFSLLTWSNYILWGKDQLNWLKKQIKFIENYLIVDFIPYEGDDILLPKSKPKKLCIFDVIPRNDLTYFKLNSQYNIYDLKYILSFLDDIIDVTKEYNNLEIYLKTKRNNKTTHPDYLNYLDEINKKNSRLKIVENNISAQSLMNGTDLSISIPYTSTALIANSLNVKSIYYDPSGILPESSNNFKLINLINGKDNLEKCITKYLK